MALSFTEFELPSFSMGQCLTRILYKRLDKEDFIYYVGRWGFFFPKYDEELIEFLNYH